MVGRAPLVLRARAFDVALFDRLAADRLAADRVATDRLAPERLTARFFVPVARLAAPDRLLGARFATYPP